MALLYLPRRGLRPSGRFVLRAAGLLRVPVLVLIAALVSCYQSFQSRVNIKYCVLDFLCRLPLCRGSAWQRQPFVSGLGRRYLRGVMTAKLSFSVVLWHSSPEGYAARYCGQPVDLHEKGDCSASGLIFNDLGFHPSEEAPFY